MIETVRFRFAVAGLLLILGGCYRPPGFDRCEVSCSASQECPEGAACLGDGFCHASGDETADCTGAPDASVDASLGSSGSVIAVGREHTCAILDDGRIACWGRGQRGQVGDNNGGNAPIPTPITSGGWSHLALGADFGCAIRDDDDTLWCWGANDLGQAGDDTAADHLMPAQVDSAVTGWTAIAGGGVHACGIAEGRLYCWGGNGYDQLGLGNDDDPVRTPTPVGAETTWETIAAGLFHTCGIRDGGRLYCWGTGGEGRLGVGDASPRDVPAEVDVGGMAWRTVAAGESHTCGIRVDGSLWCWGYSGSGQTGGASSDEPLAVDAGPWRDVAAGATHTCGVTEADELYCWGEDSLGARGDGLGSGGPGLVRIGTERSWAAVARGWGQHACARTTGGDFFCWGDAGFGQVGDGFVDRHYPDRVLGAAGWTRIAAGGDRTCGVRGDDLLCWGGDFARQAELETSPVVMTGGTGWLDVAVGAQHGCAIDGDRHLWCWGDGSGGELGNGTVEYSAEPVAIVPSREWLDVTVGQDHTCAVEQLTAGATAGPVWCWGANFDAQIRDPAMFGSDEPIETLGTADYDQVSAGQSHTCAHRSGSNTLFCWGSNTHQQTTGAGNPRWPAAEVPDAGWTWVGVGARHSCGVLVDGVRCWGADDRYQLGRGDGGAGADSGTPVVAAQSGSWDVVAGGRDHTCALDRAAPAAGDLWCWGANDDGALGVSPDDPPTDPIEVGAGTDWRDVAAGGAHTCAIDDASQLWCWGDNNLGQLGIGQSNRYAPVPVAPPAVPI